MIYVVRKDKPNVDLIKSLRKSINCTQSALLAEMKSAGYEISRRTYQKIEKGDLTQRSYLEALIKFYTNRLPASHKFKKIKIEDLYKKKEKKFKVIKNPKKTKKISKINEDFVGRIQDSQQVVMHKVMNFDDVVKNISISDKRKFYFKVHASRENYSSSDGSPISGTNAIKHIVNQIDDYKKKSNPLNEEFGSTKNEFDKLDQVTDFGESITFLHNEGISLYAGLLYLPQYKWKAADPHPANDHYTYQVDTVIYTILCFKNDTQKDLIFHYENVWPEDRLNYFLKKRKPFEIDTSDDLQVQSVNDDVRLFEDEIKYFSGINDSQVEIDHDFRARKDLLPSEMYDLPDDFEEDLDEEIPF